MRTKTLLLAVAALAAGISYSQAQNVYSQNIVGYVNVNTTGGQLSLLANPLSNGTNDLLTLFPNGSLDNGSTIQIWNGTGYIGSTKTPVGWTADLVIPPGTGFFLKDSNNKTNTFVGSVVANAGGSYTNSLASGLLVLVGSAIPYTDTLTGTNLNLTVASGSTVQFWNGTGFTGSTKTPVGWTINSTVTPGEGFFLKPNSATNWIQNLSGN